MSDGRSFSLGLVGSGIGGSLTPAMQEREGREAGLSLTYRLIDADVHGFTKADLPELLGWVRRLGFDGVNITHPFKQAVVPLLDELSDDARDLGAVNTILFREGRMLGRNTDWSGYGRAFRAVLPDAVHDRVLLIGAGGAGVAVGYGLLRQGASRVDVLDADEDAATACVERLSARFGPGRVGIAAISRPRSPALRVSSTRPRSACSATRARQSRSPACAVISGSATSSTSPSRPRSSPPHEPAAAGCSPVAGWRSSKPSGPSSTSPVYRPTPHGWKHTSRS